MAGSNTVLGHIGRLTRVEPHLDALEVAYQTETLGEDIEQASYVLILSIAGVSIWLLADVASAGRVRAASAALAGAELAITIACASIIRRWRQPRIYQWAVLGWSLSCGAVVLGLRTMSVTRYPQAAIPLLALIAYLALPNRLAFRAAPALVCTAGDWWIAARNPATASGAPALLITYVFVHIVGVWTSVRFHAARRRHFVTQREEAVTRHELAFAANHDALTGVMSRAHWMGLAAGEVSRHRRHDRSLTLLLADLDHFKDVNDAFGHEAGDRVLERFGHVLRKECRRTDIVGRLGGEEFVILLPETDLTTARDVGERIIAACRHPQVLAGCEVTVSCSVGATVVERADATIEDVLRRADAAMYTAKRGGRNRLEIVTAVTKAS